MTKNLISLLKKELREMAEKRRKAEDKAARAIGGENIVDAQAEVSAITIKEIELQLKIKDLLRELEKH